MKSISCEHNVVGKSRIRQQVSSQYKVKKLLDFTKIVSKKLVVKIIRKYIKMAYCSENSRYKNRLKSSLCKRMQLFSLMSVGSS